MWKENGLGGITVRREQKGNGIEQAYIHVYVKDSTMKLNKHCIKSGDKWGEWKYNRGGELVQSILHTYGIVTKKPPCLVNVYQLSGILSIKFC
jgi:hypothetical protein